MFHKTDCCAVICYTICITNASYEREIIVQSFPDISFVILLFVFQRFEIKFGFPFSFFFYSNCIYSGWGLYRYVCCIAQSNCYLYGLRRKHDFPVKSFINIAIIINSIF